MARITRVLVVVLSVVALALLLHDSLFDRGPSPSPSGQPSPAPSYWPSPFDGRGLVACVVPGHTWYPFCNTTLDLNARVYDLISRIRDADKPNLLTARGCEKCGEARKNRTRHARLEQQSLPYLGVPAYYWGTNWCESATCL